MVLECCVGYEFDRTIHRVLLIWTKGRPPLDDKVAMSDMVGCVDCAQQRKVS